MRVLANQTQTVRRVPGGRSEVVLDSTGWDDGAVVRCSGDFDLVVASDYVRGSEFSMYRLGHLDYYDLGYYLSVANISDLAAMGAVPVALLTVVRYADEMTQSEFIDVMRGIADGAQQYGASVIGGDTGAAERLILSATAFGIIDQGRSLLRSGARAGDGLYVTGEIGNAGAALIYFSRLEPQGRNAPVEVRERLLRAWRRPEAQVEVGRIAAMRRGVSACQDVSDGLYATLEDLGRNSGVGFMIDAHALPISSAVRWVADAVGADPVSLACSASVDFELLFTVTPGEERAVVAELARAHVVTRIGTVTADTTLSLSSDGIVRPLVAVPWRHQTDDPVGGVLGALDVRRITS